MARTSKPSFKQVRVSQKGSVPVPSYGLPPEVAKPSTSNKFLNKTPQSPAQPMNTMDMPT